MGDILVHTPFYGGDGPLARRCLQIAPGRGDDEILLPDLAVVDSGDHRWIYNVKGHTFDTLRNRVLAEAQAGRKGVG